MVLCSQYLLKPPRTLREACRDTKAVHPELIVGDCATCANGELCAISEQIERDRRGAHREDERQTGPRARHGGRP
jgi:hypothetical protein